MAENKDFNWRTVSIAAGLAVSSWLVNDLLEDRDAQPQLARDLMAERINSDTKDLIRPIADDILVIKNDLKDVKELKEDVGAVSQRITRLEQQFQALSGE